MTDWQLFPSREPALRKITRYSLYPVMFYRTNLWTHSKRVRWLAEEILPAAEAAYGPDFDSEKALLMAQIHDDLEIVLGDIQAGNKENMTSEQLQEVAAGETKAIAAVAQMFPAQVGRYRYEDVLREGWQEKTAEAFVVKYCDKYDALGEALHEVYAGNVLWTRNVTNQYGTIKTPFQYYFDYFAGFMTRFPRSRMLFEHGASIPLLGKIEWIDCAPIAQRGRRHTANSIRQPTGYAPYDAWRSCILKHAETNTEEMGNLIVPKELVRTTL